MQEPLYYIRKIYIHPNQNEILGIVLEHTDTKHVQYHQMDLDLMNFSMDIHIKIEDELNLDILVYTKRYSDGIRPTMKAFYKGDQTNQIFNHPHWKTVEFC